MMFLRLCRRSPEKTDFSLYISRLLCFLSGTPRSARSPARCARISFSFYFIIHIFISFVNTKRRICAASGGAFASFARRPSSVEPGFRTRSCRRCTWSRNEQLFFTVPRAGERIATSRFLGIAPRNDTRLCVHGVIPRTEFPQSGNSCAVGIRTPFRNEQSFTMVTHTGETACHVAILGNRSSQ